MKLDIFPTYALVKETGNSKLQEYYVLLQDTTDKLRGTNSQQIIRKDNKLKNIKSQV